MNYGEINELVSVLLGEDSSTFFTDRERMLVINQACRTIANNMDFLRNTTEISIEANKGYYILPRDFYGWGDGVDFYDGTSSSRLTYKSVQALRQEFPNWQDDTAGTPLYYSGENNYLYLYPAPGSAYTIRLNYQVAPNELVDNCDLPFYGNLISRPFHDLIAYQAAWFLLMKDHEYDSADRIQVIMNRRQIDFMEALRETGDAVHPIATQAYYGGNN